jgi:hypothetical protein
MSHGRFPPLIALGDQPHRINQLDRSITDA